MYSFAINEFAMIDRSYYFLLLKNWKNNLNGNVKIAENCKKIKLMQFEIVNVKIVKTIICT